MVTTVRYVWHAYVSLLEFSTKTSSMKQVLVTASDPGKVSRPGCLCPALAAGRFSRD